MTCRETERLITPYINGQLTEQELEDFLEHIDSCGECREELEIYFMVDMGIRQLDGEADTFNIKAELEEALELSRQRIHTIHLLLIARYAVCTLCFWSVLIIFMMQMRIWSQTGFLGL